MPLLTFPFTPENGPLIQVMLGRAIPGAPTSRSFMALIDTGAERSSIDAVVVETLDLQAVAESTLVTPTTPGGKPTSEYEVKLVIEHPHLHWELPRLRATRAHLSDQGFGMILGRDVLRNVALYYDGPAGTLSLCL